MNRVRISTTVDGERLKRARRLVGVRDSDLFDMALEAIVREVIIARELTAIDRFPYVTDPDLAMPMTPIDTDDAMAYDGEVPARVRALAKRRREQRQRVSD
ncbi:MAG: hypothetical protein ACSLFB_06020 [Acidimicrobiales bacterium]